MTMRHGPITLPDHARDQYAREAPGESYRRPPDAPMFELDVRDDLRSGREPFSKIMAAAAALPVDAVLHLRATFEPLPLFTVLGKRGFVHEVREHAEDDWSVWFWRPAPEHNTDPGAAEHGHTPPDQPAGIDPAGPGDPQTVWLDVRGLEPPEPMMRTLAALATLSDGHQLVQVNVRVPQFLLPMLAERGYACDVDASHADRVLVRIWRLT